MKLAPVSLVTIVVCFSAAALAQAPCTSETLAQKPGSLRASRLSGSTGGMSAADVARARATLTKIHQTLAAGYRPVGVVGDYGFKFSGGPTGSTFGYSLYLLKYSCEEATPDRSDHYIGTDTPTVVRIDANVINAFSLSSADTSDNTFRGFLYMRNVPKKVDGVYYLGENPSGSFKEKQKEYTWLVTYGDEYPFTVLTRREYLLLTKERLQKSIRENGNSSGYYNEFVNRVDEYLRKSESELIFPAIVSRTDDERFTGFLQEGDRSAFYAIKHNPAYYRKGLPKSAAQFFTVTYSVYEGDPVYPANIDAVKKALDLNALRAMLGK